MKKNENFINKFNYHVENNICAVIIQKRLSSVMDIVSMTDILDYLGDSIRPLKEGLNLYKSNHVLDVGISNLKENVVDVYSQVVQSSDPKGLPHRVNIKLVVNKSNLWCYNFSFKGKLDAVSKTDVEQAWGTTARERTFEEFDAKLMVDLCCVKAMPQVRKLSHEIKESNFRKLIAAAPESAVAIHFNQKRTLSSLSESVLDQGKAHLRSPKHDEILENALNKPALHQTLKVRIVPQMGPRSKDFYLKYIFQDLDGIKEINRKTLGQRNNFWKIERRKRITASDACKLYTYCNNKNPNWSKKIEDYLNPTNFENASMKYGSQTEKDALALYEKQYNCVIERLGFVVSHALPWMGCSVDGFIPALNKIVEFKCPVLGATKEKAQVLPTLNYLDENLYLKEKHMYYCQVQLGMAIMNATSCDFVVFCKFEKEMHVITILLDKNIIEKYVISLTDVYFKHMLPALSS